MTNEPEWMGNFEKKIEENYFVTPSSHLNVDGLKSFIQDTIKEEKEKAELYRLRAFEEGFTKGEQVTKKLTAELLSKIEEEVEGIKTDGHDECNEDFKLNVLNILSKYKVNK